MQKRRRIVRLVLAGGTAALALAGLTGCRTSPDVAAYVGDQQITVSQLQQAVHQRLSDQVMAAAETGKSDAYTRTVLTNLVNQDVYREVADRYGVQVSDEAVRQRLADLIGEQNPEAVYANAAQQGISRQDLFELVRQWMIDYRLAVRQGLAKPITDQQLRQEYATETFSSATVQFGYIVVPDKATADTVLAQLQANPADYAALAKQHPGGTVPSLPSIETRPGQQVPQELTDALAGLTPGHGAAVPIPQAGEVVVAFLAGITPDPSLPSFEQLRPQLEMTLERSSGQAAQSLVSKVRSAVDITVNPRYGELNDKGVVAPGGGKVVTILSGPGATSQTSAPGAASAGG